MRRGRAPVRQNPAPDRLRGSVDFAIVTLNATLPANQPSLSASLRNRDCVGAMSQPLPSILAGDPATFLFSEQPDCRPKPMCSEMIVFILKTSSLNRPCPASPQQRRFRRRDRRSPWIRRRQRFMERHWSWNGTGVAPLRDSDHYVQRCGPHRTKIDHRCGCDWQDNPTVRIEPQETIRSNR